ncbi:hypothetical protein B566_EDAN015868 [Ephemera danica]|nr:hypothetical protein B566_EDAN015868 [Ephemera danica]
MNWSRLQTCVGNGMFSAFLMKFMNGWCTNLTNTSELVFSQTELEQIADLCRKWNVLCISDEVYEWMVYKPHKHIRIATLPDMWNRTITIGSAGKTFSVTGWKLGWAYGPAKLLNNLQTVHQNCEAVARGLELELARQGQPDCYFTSLAEELLPKREVMAQFLRDTGMRPVIPDAARADLSQEKDAQRDYRFTKWMTKTLGLQGIPPSAFYSGPHKHLAEDYVRYCFIKRDEVLQKAADILHKWKSS